MSNNQFTDKKIMDCQQTKEYSDVDSVNNLEIKDKKDYLGINPIIHSGTIPVDKIKL